MRVLLAHNVYRQRGGEERAVVELKASLEKRGHTVRLFQRKSEEWDNFSVFQKLAAAVQTPYSFSSKAALKTLLDEFSPDVVHAHNIFPLLSPSIYDAAHEKNVPVVQTLHNFRLFCMNGLLFRNGRPCELCVEGGTWHGAVHACYQNSHPSSAMMATTLGLHRSSQTWTKKIDRFVALSDFSRKMYEKAGFPTEKMTVLPNAVEIGPKPEQKKRTSLLFMGRLSQEKGVKTLLEAYRLFQKNREITLNVAGEGPLMEFVQRFAKDNPGLKLKILGHVTGDAKKRLLEEAAALVFPSECYENCPYGVLEALAHGVPVIGTKRGAIPELIQHGRTGWLVEAGSAASLAGVFDEALKKSDEMRSETWEEARRKFSLDPWIKEIENLYDSVSVLKP